MLIIDLLFYLINNKINIDERECVLNMPYTFFFVIISFINRNSVELTNIFRTMYRLIVLFYNILRFMTDGIMCKSLIFQFN